jgi:hypothetical protein
MFTNIGVIVELAIMVIVAYVPFIQVCEPCSLVVRFFAMRPRLLNSPFVL